MKRVAIIGGCRTPFVKAGGPFAQASFLDMAVHIVQALQRRLSLTGKDIDELVYSTVLLDPRVPNAARELVFRAGLPKSLSAHFVSNNCISGIVAASVVADGIQCGRIQSGIAGGSESMSRPTLTLRSRAEKFFLNLARARTVGSKLKILSSFRPGMLIPIPPSPKEPSTGLTMGEHCELMAKEFAIERSVQDKIAYLSHHNAASSAAQLKSEIEPFLGVESDNLVRKDTSLEKLAKLPPVFDRSSNGTITAGNSSGLTDGASAVYLMEEGIAKQQGRKILGIVEAIEFSAIDPKDGLLMAPALAVPSLLKKRDLKLEDIGVLEIHEAFGAQVAANLLVWERGWAKYPAAAPIGRINLESINKNGGSIAIGHPFAATGGRLLISACNQLRHSDKNYALISVCAAGAMAAAVLISRD